MARTLIEFACNDCIGWFIVNINLGLDGYYAFVCPNCKRAHPREIVKGEVIQKTEEIRTRGNIKINIRRDGASESNRERILAPISSYSKKPRLELLEKVKSGFMAEAWMRKAAAEIGIGGD